MAEKRSIIPHNDLLQLAKRDETELLALMLNDKDLLEQVISRSCIMPEYFLTEELSNLFQATLKYYDKYAALLTRDALRKIVEEMNSISDAVAAQWMVLYDSVSNLRVDPENFLKLIDNLESRYVQQKYFELMVSGDNLSHQMINTTCNQKELMSKIQDRINSIRVGEDGDRYRLCTLKDSLSRVMNSVEKRRDNQEAERGIMSGFSDIDNTIFGFPRGKYVIVVGFPNGGKTTLMLNMALNMALRGNKIVFVTIEMTEDEITERLLTAFANIPSRNLRCGGKGEDGIHDGIYNKLIAAAEHLEKIIGENLVFVSVAEQTKLEQILALVNRKRKYMDIDAMFVDYLDVIKPSVHYPNRPDLELADVSIRLQAYGKKNNILTVTANSLTNTKMKEIRKKNQSAKSETPDIDDVDGIFIEDVGGTQKLGRDCDYMLGCMFNKLRDRLCIWWTKARLYAPAGTRFVLACDQETGRLTDCRFGDMDVDDIHNMLNQADFSTGDDLFAALSDDVSEESFQDLIDKAFDALFGESQIVEPSGVDTQEENEKPIRAIDQDASELF